jgi:hypothetical protein
MSDPITYGVIGGILESMLMGQAAEKEAEKKAEEAAAEARATSTANFMEGAKDPRAARAIMLGKDYDPRIGGVYYGLNPTDRATIWSYSQRDLPVPDYDKNVLSEINTPEQARAALDNPDLLKYLEIPSRQLITTLAATPITAAERDILSTITGTKEEQIVKLESFYGMYDKDSSFGKVLRARASGLMGIAAPAPEYKAIDEDGIRDLLKTAFSEDAGPNAGTAALVELSRIQNDIEPYIFGKNIEESQSPDGKTVLPDYIPNANPQAVQDYLLISMMKATYATRDTGDTDTEEDWVELFNTSLENLNALSETAVGGDRLVSSAEAQLKVFKAKGFDPETATPEELIRFTQIKEFAKEYKKVDEGTVVFGAGTPNEIALDNPKENPLKALMMLNENAEQVAKMYAGLQGDEKSKFEREVTGLLFLDNQQTNTTTTRQGGVSETVPETNFIDVLPALYDKLPFVKKFIHEDLKYPNPGETATGLKTVSVPQLEDDGRTPLAPDFFRVSDSLVLEATPEVKALASAVGKTPQQYLLSNSIAYNMINTTSQNPFALFEASSGLVESNIFRKDQPLRKQHHGTLARTFISRGIMDRQEQLDVIASVMPVDLPPQFQRVFGQRTITEKQLNEMMEYLTGRQINMEDISKSKVNSESFLSVADEVLYRIEQAPEGSAAYNELAATLLNLFGVENSFAASIKNGVMRRIGGKFFADNESLFRYDDMLVENGQSAANVRAGVLARAEAFMDNNFLANNATLKSALVTLAYNYAKTMDPSGRISERDFQAALEAVSAGAFDTRTTRLAVVRRLVNQAEDNVAFHGRIFDVSSKMQGNTRVFNITNTDVQNMRALRHFTDLKRVTRGREIVLAHQNIVDQSGDNYIKSKDWQSVFVADAKAANLEFGEDVTIDYGIRALKIRNGVGSTAHPMGSGIPIYYFQETGEILTPRQVRVFKGMSGV